MFCTKCGHENDDSAKFCNKCGAPISADLKADAIEKAKHKKSAKIRSGAIMSLFGALLGMVASFLFYMDGIAGGRIVLCLMYIIMTGISISILCNVPALFAKIGSILNVVLSLGTSFLVVIISLGGVIQLFTLDFSITFFYVPALVIAEIILIIGCIKTVIAAFSH